MAIQPILTRTSNNSGSTLYTPPGTGIISSNTYAAEADGQIAWPVAGDFRYVDIFLDESNAIGTFQVVVRIGGSDTVYDHLFPTGSTGSALHKRLVLDVAVAAGDLVTIKCIHSGLVVIQALVALGFEATTQGEYVLICNQDVTSGIATDYSFVVQGSITEEGASGDLQPFPLAGTLDKFYVRTENDPTDTLDVNVLKNAVDAAIVLAVTTGNTTDEDLSNSFTVVAGDTVLYEMDHPAITAGNVLTSCRFTSSDSDLDKVPILNLIREAVLFNQISDVDAFIASSILTTQTSGVIMVPGGALGGFRGGRNDTTRLESVTLIDQTGGDSDLELIFAIGIDTVADASDTTPIDDRSYNYMRYDMGQSGVASGSHIGFSFWLKPSGVGGAAIHRPRLGGSLRPI